MRLPFLFTASVLSVASAVQAAAFQHPESAPSLPEFAGTYHAATAVFEPALGVTEGTSACGEGRVYVNTDLVGGFYFDISEGYDLIDQGRVPSTGSGGPADAYRISAFDLAYATDVARPVNLVIMFWENGAEQLTTGMPDCIGIADLDLANGGSPTASLQLIGLPGSPTAGVLETYVVTIDLTGMEFTLAADGNGIAGDGSDLFNWSIRVVGQTISDRTGPFLAGNPLTCAHGAGTFGDPGCGTGGTGSGLGTLDSFRVDDTNGVPPFAPGCYSFGGYNPSTPVPFSSYYLDMTSSRANDDCDSPTDLLSAVGNALESSDSCCASTSLKQPAACTASTIHDDVWYVWTAPSAGAYLASTCGSGYDTKLAVYAGSDCSLAACIGYNDDACGLQSEVAISAAAGDTFLIQLGGFSSSSCGTYQININPDACNPILDDQQLGENDACEDGSEISDGNWTGLYSFPGDDDFYSTTVCAGETFDALVSFIHANGDIDVSLNDVTAGCGAPSFLAGSTSQSDDEQVTWVNTGVAPVRVSLRVYLSHGSCNTYDLALSGSCPLGTPYCGPGVQNPNSTGQIAQIYVAGSPIAVDDDLSLLATGMPLNQLGYFIWSLSPAAISLPGISDGILCMGSGKGRFNGQNGSQGGALTSGPAGAFSLNGIDTTMMPQSSSVPIAIMAGLDGYFQAWYRDPSGPVGNHFTNAISVTWQ